MNLKELKEIIAIFEDADISELDLEREGVHVRLKKGITIPTVSVSAAPELPLAAVKQKQELAEPLTEGIEKKEGEEKHLYIESPMVGTFYRAPAPDANPFVEVGQEFEKDHVVCIIEAMKLMNEIKSDIRGKIVKVLVENGQAVEFGQPLFLVEPL